MASVSELPLKNQAQIGTVHWYNSCVERGKSGVFSEVVSLTPGLASVMLARNPDNRQIRHTKAAQYAQDMRNGRWTFNGEPIIVSDDGFLNDGQHRCQAIIDANICIEMIVVFGVPRASRITIDQGAARGAGDYLKMEGVQNWNVAATIARLVLAYEQSNGLAIDTKPITNGEVMDRVHADAKIAEAAHFASTMSRHVSAYAAGTLIGFCYYLFERHDENDAKTFLTQVSKGEGLKAGSAALVLRERLLAEGKARQPKVCMIFRAWNFYRRGMKVSASALHGKMPLPALI